MKAPKDYIIFPLDVPTADQARHWVTLLHAHVGMFKVGLELFVRTGPSLLEWISDHASAGIFLDLKLHDIPATVRRAMAVIADLHVTWTTVHIADSQAMLEAAVDGSRGRVKVLGVTVLTSVSAADLQAAGGSGDLARVVQQRAARAKAAGCSGVICSGHEAARIKQELGRDFLAVTPGIRPAGADSRGDDQQRIVTPAMAVAAGADGLVIGRPIRDAADPLVVLQQIAAEIQAAIAPAGITGA